MMSEKQLDSLIETVTVMNENGFPSMKNELKLLTFIKNQTQEVQ